MMPALSAREGRAACMSGLCTLWTLLWLRHTGLPSTWPVCHRQMHAPCTCPHLSTQAADRRQGTCLSVEDVHVWVGQEW